MKASDILTATHQLEDTGMSRSQSEIIAKTVAAAVQPLATGKDLKAEIATYRKEIQAEFADLREANKANMDSLKVFATKKDVENLKIWFWTVLLALTGPSVAVVAGIVILGYR